ncbi:hypothetical protein [Nocardioides sp. CFH 31398]|uniref:hypothetical protein n=1 Tax=Nocardioides sp. CFH 31398 TaxID=2919579 RepID=UPI001F059F22|nr:hypothetical protein [Nocardioides sp. CFH 31398]MCH1868793.1 hypothetical protein [Nocardioides sp. CFH 31398]
MLGSAVDGAGDAGYCVLEGRVLQLTRSLDVLDLHVDNDDDDERALGHGGST